MEKTDDLLTQDETLALLKVCRATLYNLIEKHDFPRPIKLASCNRWYRSEVEAWVARRPRATMKGGIGASVIARGRRELTPVPG